MMNKKSLKYIDFSGQYDKFKLMNTCMSMMTTERVGKGKQLLIHFRITENNLVLAVNGVHSLLR